ncbi:hypothetical protein [Streptomyces sp. NBC_01497]|uniref:hypothetical protein n=1 Tax=Streptomyces sp. NBC_01497 TaxID=2903885 RepID=UPI002E2F8362|nr:hypothetical protein [Streptomyces sp. NBC_01497]
MPGTDDELERQLRAVLRRGVPPLTAPGDRMRQIRHRVGLRRLRRLLLAAAVTAAAAVALGGYVLGPGPLPGSGAQGPGAVTPAAPPRAVPPGAVPGLVPRTVDVLGVTITLPGGWHPVSAVDERGIPHEFVGNRVVADTATCVRAGVAHYACLPLLKLTGGQVLISFEHTEAARTPYGTEPFTVKAVHAPGAGCLALGGDRELTGRGEAPAGKGWTITAHACLSHASDATLAVARKVLESAVLTDPAPTPTDATAPASTPTDGTAPATTSPAG